MEVLGVSMAEENRVSFFTRVKEINKAFFAKEALKRDLSASQLMDIVIERLRKEKSGRTKRRKIKA